MDYVRLSKELSFALRHAPWEYELELDESGWVDIHQVLDFFNNQEEWHHLAETDLWAMIAAGNKKRHEIQNGKIRALYGHSIPQKIIKEKHEPLEQLFHGTARRFILPIKENGLLPRQRQYVHLSVDVETANEVGKRKDHHPIILKVNAGEAWKEGIDFYIGNEKVWLADFIPSRFIIFE